MTMMASMHAVELDETAGELATWLQGREANPCAILTQQGEPIAVIQKYETYQQLLNRLAETQKALHIAETRERLRQMNDGSMRAIPFEQIVAQNFSCIMGDNHELSR